MAPQIEEIYTRLERLFGEKFCQQLYGALDEMIVKLEAAGDGPNK